MPLIEITVDVVLLGPLGDTVSLQLNECLVLYLFKCYCVL